MSSSPIDPNSKGARRQAADSLSRNPMRMAWTADNAVELTHNGDRIVVPREEWLRFTRALLRGEFRLSSDGIRYAVPQNPNAPGKANVVELPTDRELAPAVVQALGSAASLGDIASAYAQAAETAPQPTPPPEPPVTPGACVR